MPQAITHFIFSLVLFTIVWSFTHRNGKRPPLFYALIAGLGGLVPDLDYALFWFMYSLKYLSDVDIVHRTFTHSLLFPLALSLIAFALMRVRFKIRNYKKLFEFLEFFSQRTNKTTNPNLKKGVCSLYQINVGAVLAIVAFGSLTHIVLDAVLSGYIRPLYPFFSIEVGTGLLDGIKPDLRQQLMATLDGLIFVFWIIYLALTKRIQRLI